MRAQGPPRAEGPMDDMTPSSRGSGVLRSSPWLYRPVAARRTASSRNVQVGTYPASWPRVEPYPHELARRPETPDPTAPAAAGRSATRSRRRPGSRLRPGTLSNRSACSACRGFIASALCRCGGGSGTSGGSLRDRDTAAGSPPPRPARRRAATSPRSRTRPGAPSRVTGRTGPTCWTTRAWSAATSAPASGPPRPPPRACPLSSSSPCATPPRATRSRAPGCTCGTATATATTPLQQGVTAITTCARPEADAGGTHFTSIPRRTRPGRTSTSRSTPALGATSSGPIVKTSQIRGPGACEASTHLGYEQTRQPLPVA